MAGFSSNSVDSVHSTPWLRTLNQAFVGVGLGLSTGCLIMRIYTKKFIIKNFWWDDVFLIFAWICIVGVQTIILYAWSHAGVGIHETELSPSTLEKLQRLVLAVSIVYIPCLAFAKLALLMMYYRLLQSIRAYVYTLYIVGFVIVGYSIALTLALLFACTPLEKNWTPSITEGSCINRPGAYMATAVTNTASDLVLIVIPVRVIWKLRLRVAEKLGAVLVFGIGCLTIITSILRLATLWPLVTSNDFSYKLALVWTFANIEANFIILCGSLPYLRQFLRYYVPKWFRRRRSSRGSGSEA